MAVALIAFLTVFLAGCGDNPGDWDLERIELEMETYAGMEQLDLKEHDDGSITADGVDREGRKFTFTIEQDSETGELKWTGVDEDGRHRTTFVTRKPH